MSEPLADALRRQYVAGREVAAVMRNEYPIGADVSWRRNGLHHGTVIRHGRMGGIKVRNSKTNREPWIAAYDIVNAM